MRKVLLNIQIGDSIRQVICQYDTQFDIYELEEDIVVNDWKIKGFVKHEKNSGYDSCFEFVISDRLDRERSKTYYYTGRAVYHPNECGLKGSSDLSPQGVISFYINNCPIFSCKDWDEYESHLILYKIQTIINNGHSKQEQLKEIKNIL